MLLASFVCSCFNSDHFNFASLYCDLCLKINERSRSDVKSDSLWFITTRYGTIVMAHYHNTNFVRSWSPIANTCVFFLNFKISNSVRIKKSIKGLCPASLWNENRIFQVRNFRNRRNELVSDRNGYVFLGFITQLLCFGNHN